MEQETKQMDTDGYDGPLGGLICVALALVIMLII